MKYRKKPVVIEAVRLLDGEVDEKPSWVERAFKERTMRTVHGGSIMIDTLEGVMTAIHGDYIIRGVQGEIYPCKPDIFEKTYEEVTDDD